MWCGHPDQNRQPCFPPDEEPIGLQCKRTVSDQSVLYQPRFSRAMLPRWRSAHWRPRATQAPLRRMARRTQDLNAQLWYSPNMHCTNMIDSANKVDQSSCLNSTFTLQSRGGRQDQSVDLHRHYQSTEVRGPDDRGPLRLGHGNRKQQQVDSHSLGVG